MWVACPFNERKWGSPFEITVQISSCLDCEIVCPNKKHIIEQLLKEHSSEEELRSKGRIITVKNMRFCPLKTGKECNANRRYCKYNAVCPNRRFEGRHKLLRWRKVMKYGIKYKGNETVQLCEKDDVNNLTEAQIKDVEKAYKITHALISTVELIPYTDEGEEIKNSVKVLVEKYGNNVLDEEGNEVKLSSWHTDAEMGQISYVFSEELAPVKVVKAVPIDRYYSENQEPEAPKPKKGEPKPKTEEPKKKRVEPKKKKAAPKVEEAPKPFTEGIPDSTPEAPFGYTQDGTPRQRRPRRTAEELAALGIASRAKG